MSSRSIVIPDRSGWGYTGVNPTRITVPWVCIFCGGERGEPYWHNFCEDGHWYQVHRWDNPCGHVEKYTDVWTLQYRRGSSHD